MIHESCGTYNPSSEIEFNINMLWSSLRDYSDAYILFVGKYYWSRRRCNSKASRQKKYASNTLKLCAMDDAKDLDVVMPVHNLLDYSHNYEKTSGSL